MDSRAALSEKNSALKNGRSRVSIGRVSALLHLFTLYSHSCFLIPGVPASHRSDRPNADRAKTIEMEHSGGADQRHSCFQ